MSERDVVFDALYAIRDRGLPRPDMARLTAEMQAVVERREIEYESEGRRWLPGCGRTVRTRVSLVWARTLWSWWRVRFRIVLLHHRGATTGAAPTPRRNG